MADWVTLQNGVHIDLDDPNNPLTGSGSFESYLGGGSSSGSSGNKALDKDMASLYKEYGDNFHPDDDILYDLRESGKDYGMSNEQLENAVRTYVKERQDDYQKKIKAGPKTQAALKKDVSKWLNANTDLIKYDKVPGGGRGVNGKVISDLANTYLKDVLGIEVSDSIVYDYDSGLKMTHAVLDALDDVWRNEHKSKK